MAEKKEKKTKWSQKFKTEYSAMWPCVKESEKGIYHAFCTLCSANISVEHGGRDCIRRHVNSKRHTEIAKSRSTSSSTWMKHFTKPGTYILIACCLIVFLYLVYEFSPYVVAHGTSFMERLREEVNLTSPAVILLAITIIVLCIVFGVGMYSDLFWNRRFMACLLISIFVISFIWNWIFLYQEEVIRRYSDAQKNEKIPANCTPHMTWVQVIQGWFTSMMSVRDECFEYHRNFLVNPLFDVPPIRALSATVSSLIVDLFKYFGLAISEFHAEIFRKNPFWVAIFSLVTCDVFGLLALYCVYAYTTAPRIVLRERQRTTCNGSCPGTELTDFPNDNRLSVPPPTEGNVGRCLQPRGGATGAR